MTNIKTSDRKTKKGMAYDKKSGKLIPTGQYSGEAIDQLIASGGKEDVGFLLVVLIIFVALIFILGGV